ncbi:hypothetical protein Tco_1180301 [Tanacetum coccineum]
MEANMGTDSTAVGILLLGIMNSEAKQRKVIVHRKHSRLTEKARTEGRVFMVYGQCLFEALDGIEVAPLDPNDPFTYHVDS